MPTPPKTVRDATEDWLRRCAREGLDTQTLKAYRSQAANHILLPLGDMELAELRRADVKAFVEAMLDGNSREMTRKVLVSLKSLLKEAVEREWIQASPAAEVMLKRQKRHDKQAGIPTKEEIRRLIAHAPGRHRALIVTAIFTGLRIPELRGLAWEHVDFARRIIRVRQRANRSSEIGSPKSKAGTRDIPMTPLAAEALERWRPDCPAGELGLVFPNGRGNPETCGNIMRRIYYPLQLEAGITDRDGKPKYGFHALRHACSSLMIEQGWPVKKIQTVLGHRSIVMTLDVYGHLFTRTKDDVALFDKLESDLMAA